MTYDDCTAGAAPRPRGSRWDRFTVERTFSSFGRRFAARARTGAAARTGALEACIVASILRDRFRNVRERLKEQPVFPPAVHVQVNRVG